MSKRKLTDKQLKALRRRKAIAAAKAKKPQPDSTKVVDSKPVEQSSKPLQSDTKVDSAVEEKADRKKFPDKFPFWARFKPNKRRPTLVIDEDEAYDKDKHKKVDGFVHRETIHRSEKNQKYIDSGDYEEVKPNPDKSDPEPMYLKRPTKKPKRMFDTHDDGWDIPEHLRLRYEKNNKKDDKKDE